MAELKPCPFCLRADAPTIVKRKPFTVCGTILTDWYIYCENCGARGPEQRLKKQAIDAWNKRS